MRAAYVVEDLTAGSVRALNYTPEIDRIRRLSRTGRAAPLGRLASEIGTTYAKVLARVDCSPEHGTELLGQVDIFAAEPKGRVIRGDLIPFVDDLRIRRWDILIAGVGQLGETTLFGRAIIADKRLEGKLAAGDVLILRFPNPGDDVNLFTYAFLNSRIGLRAVRSCAYGTSIPRIRLDLLSSIPVPLPDDGVRGRVAQHIRETVERREGYLSNLGAARELIEGTTGMAEAREACAERKTRILIHDGRMQTLQAWTYASTGGALEFLQKKWPGRLGDVLKPNGVFNGPRFARIPCQPPNGVDFLSQRHVFLVRPVFRRIKHPGFADRLLFVPEGSLLVGGQGTLGEGEIFGRVLYVHGQLARIAYTQHLLRLQPKPEFAAQAYGFLSTLVGFRLLRSTAVGTKLLSMRPDLLRDLPFPDCDSATTRKIARHLDAAMSAREEADRAEQEAIRILEEEVLPAWLN